MISMRYSLVYNVPFKDIKDVRDMRHMGMRQVIFFGQGKFDRYCAYAAMFGSDGNLWAAMPSDKYYFEIAECLAGIHGKYAVYEDVKHIFEHVGKTIDNKLADEIYRMAANYGMNFEWALNMFMHIYYGMVAEENKEHTKLGASIKMNGIHSLLMVQRPVHVAADECRNVPWQDIREECVKRHIWRFV